MKPPQGFRTFQIVLSAVFLGGFLLLLVFFIWRISNLNTDIHRISISSHLRAQVATLLSDARACELNFGGMILGRDPQPLRKIVNLREAPLLRADTVVGSQNILLDSMRVIPSLEIESSGGELFFDIELVFSDESHRKSPYLISVLGQGEKVSGSEGYRVRTCIAKTSDFVD
ncbi:MAG: hypothetical protein KDD34_05745 [Bdellovibrionales bacterium]|nr:hypothetical protein [Bdellovibrionales bacterium]